MSEETPATTVEELMTTTNQPATSGEWVREFPTVEGFYWARLREKVVHVMLIDRYGNIKNGAPLYSGMEFLGPITPADFEELQRLRVECETLIYWLLRAYQSGHREGWEEGPSTDETMDGLCSVLANRGYDPNEDEAAKELLKQTPKY